ncbi:unnamed protein product [Cylicocyclus nassatus]|uniref:Major facilitator superfamily (MFS) profile domain-containing protein n=1 Tax=Cylicocyclus nassatus TaxID=53992 RepID=A0AA36DJG3_CYLNA|nr:unnamed protein product [Cylicocyclus nassatus]
MLLRNGVGPFKWVKTVRSDPIICGVGAFLAAPFLHLSLIFIPVNIVTAWICMFITITAACFNWAIIVDLMMDIIIPPRRNAAIAWQMMISHAFGDAFGPYIIGAISDAVREGDTSPGANFKSLVASFHLPNVLLLLSAILFFCSAYTFVKDNIEFKKIMGTLDGIPVSKESDVSKPDAK